jgi:hypothetical protein
MTSTIDNNFIVHETLPESVQKEWGHLLLERDREKPRIFRKAYLAKILSLLHSLSVIISRPLELSVWGTADKAANLGR